MAAAHHFPTLEAFREPSPRLARNLRIWRVVASIPAGRVATYGDVARAAGLVHGARQVGRAMRECPSDWDIPWHRVLAAGGRIALPGERGAEQRRRLESEQVPFRRDRVLLEACRCDPRWI